MFSKCACQKNSFIFYSLSKRACFYVQQTYVFFITINNVSDVKVLKLCSI